MGRLERTCLGVAAMGAALLVAVAAPAAWVARRGVSATLTGDGASLAARATAFLVVAGAIWAWMMVTGLWRHRHETDEGSAARGETATAPSTRARPATDGSGGEMAAAPQSTLGLATTVTLVRLWLTCTVGGFLILPAIAGVAGWVVGLAYTTAALLDNVDGRVARRRGRTTGLGARLDVATDALGLLVAPAVAVRAGRLPVWYLLLAVAYPLVQLGLRWRAWRGKPVFRERLQPNPRARFFAGVQMSVVAASLYPVLPRWLTFSAATVAMVPTLVLFAREWRLATRP